MLLNTYLRKITRKKNFQIEKEATNIFPLSKFFDYFFLERMIRLGGKRKIEW